MHLKSSELILNKDKSVYHLALKKQDVSELIIFVGDPDRVSIIGKFMKNIRVKKQNREFRTLTGEYQNKEITVISTGIGCDNIDIVMNELNVLAKYDVETHKKYEHPSRYKIVRLGTSGSFNEEISTSDIVYTHSSVGLDGLMHYYSLDYTPEEHKKRLFIEQKIQTRFPFIKPYVIDKMKNNTSHFESFSKKGITVTCQGFYHPQGRLLWGGENQSILEILKSNKNDEIQLSNFEMETSGIYGLARYFDFEYHSLSLIAADRLRNQFIKNMNTKMKNFIEQSMNAITA